MIEQEIKDLKKSLYDQLEKAGLAGKMTAGLLGLGALASHPQSTSHRASTPPPSKPYVEEQAKWAEDEGRLKPGDKLESYLDPRHLPVEEHYEDKYGLPRRSITAIRLAGERSNWSASSSAKTRSPYQFTANSRKLYMDKYGVDAWEDSINSIHATALHLVESRKWAKNKFKLKNEHDIAVKASQHFHAGPNVLEKWGPINKDYGLRYNIGLLHLQNNPSAENLEHLFNGKKVKKQYLNEQKVGPSKLQMSVKDEIKDLKKSIASLQEKIK